MSEVERGPPSSHASPDAGAAPDLSRRYLALAAEAADRLLAATDPARMVDELFALIRAELRLDVFFNYRHDEGLLRLEAYAGLTAQQARDGAQLRLGEAVCGCAALERRRIHASGVQGSDDPHLAFVRSVGLDCYACTPLLDGERLLGTLGFGRRDSTGFTAEELQLLHTLCHYVALAKLRLRHEEELCRNIAERDRLLAELNHRVRNNLQMAVGVVRNELRGAGPVPPALTTVAERLELIALAHRPLYQADGASLAVDAVEILHGAVELTTGGEGRVEAAEPVMIPIEQAVAFSLLIHALLDRRDRAGARVAVARRAATLEARITLAAQDAAAPPLDRLASSLLRQLNASLSDEAGAIHLRFPLAHAG
ncbi:GAF domain-containing protein [Sphingomonas sp. RHCKR7]|uniref:GAF domain-containing protein n=1 Tax=Sphingomonas folli TaxID=2862497 RepID=UPI001CA5714E|nr:GAF domain-containing protein [Sphingomonas folli]MBW6526717.1 GAF domain-containing protein [Sphingomonas folli]